jgi:predicted secreted protein
MNTDRVLYIKFDDTFAIDLDETPTTGYRWINTNIPEGLTLVSENFELLNREMTGSGGKHRFNFKALRSGEFDLIFFLSRTHQDSINRMNFKVIIG